MPDPGTDIQLSDPYLTDPQLRDLESRILELGDRLNQIQRVDPPLFNRIPQLDGTTGVPPAENFHKISETQVVGTTHLVLGFTRPASPNIHHFELWAKRATAQSENPYKVADIDKGPAAISLNSSEDVTIVLFLRTVMKNGLGTNLSSSPTVATQVTIAGADVPDGSITTNKLADFAVTNAKIANSTITNAKISNLAAEKILAGTMSAVNVEAGTFDLISSPNRMRINGTLGFYQLQTSTNEFVQIFGGQYTSGHVSNGTATVLDVGTSGSNSVGQLALYSATSGSATTRHVMLAGSTTSTYSIQNSSGNNLVVLTVSTNGSVALANSAGTGEIELQARASSNAGNSLEMTNSSGTWRVRSGVVNSGADGTFSLNTASGNTVDLRSGSSGVSGLYVGGTRVVAAQGATISDPTGGTTQDAEARTAINAIIDRLQAHGLIA